MESAYLSLNVHAYWPNKSKEWKCNQYCPIVLFSCSYVKWHSFLQSWQMIIMIKVLVEIQPIYVCKVFPTILKSSSAFLIFESIVDVHAYKYYISWCLDLVYSSTIIKSWSRINIFVCCMCNNFFLRCVGLCLDSSICVFHLSYMIFRLKMIAFCMELKISGHVSDIIVLIFKARSVLYIAQIREQRVESKP